MKSFLKYLLASILGTLIVGLIMFFIFLGSLSAIIAHQEKPATVKSNSILYLKLDKPIEDRKPSIPFNFTPFNFKTPFAEQVLGLNEILRNIEKAAKDDNIKGICLDLSTIQSGYATIEEIRNALVKFKETGKFIISYSDDFRQPPYYLASVSDKIYMNPEGSLYLIGLKTELLFFKNAFDKLGINPEVIRHGKFKSAVEPLIDTKMSDANREQIRSYMGSIWEHLVTSISESRGITTMEINNLANNLSLWNSAVAVEHKLIDSLIYRDELISILKEKSGTEDQESPNLVAIETYDKVPEIRTTKGLIKEKIAIIYASGDIVSGEDYTDEIGAHKISRTIREARADSSIKAIVFRVNSPGGSALASELIWRELDLAKKVKPVIASMGDVAASGGYYILAPADTIVANPVTITGSIGVFGVLMNMKDLMNKKLGITYDAETTNTYSNIGTPFRPLSQYELQILEKGVNKTYYSFVDHVAEGRGLTFDQVDNIAEGRVWSGINAKKIGLIDTYGGLTEAIKIAAEKAHIETYRIVELPKLQEPLQQLLKQVTGDIKIKLIKNELGDDYKYYQLLRKAKNMNGIQARLPYEISLN